MKTKTLTLLSLAGALTLFTQNLRAATWFAPTLDGDHEIWVVNAGPSEQTVWLSPPHRDGNRDKEISVILPARASRALPLTKSSESFWQIRSLPTESLTVWVKQGGDMIEVPAGRSSRRQISRPQVGETLLVTNLSEVAQKARVTYQTSQGPLESQVNLEPFAQTKVTLPTAKIESIEITGEHNLLGHLISAQATRFGRPLPEPTKVTSGVRFLVGQANSDMSFVVQIDDPQLIEQARAQISSPNDFRARILIGEIAAGSGLVNQNLVSPLKGSWSWHVSKVVKFAELASQSCDGSPEFVESYLGAWLKSQSKICFWNYRIVKELKP